jgi:hypothetical protein
MLLLTAIRVLRIYMGNYFIFNMLGLLLEWKLGKMYVYGILIWNRNREIMINIQKDLNFK